MTQPSISSSDRIRELSSINADVPILLSAAGNAINTLTGRPLSDHTKSTHDGDVIMRDEDVAERQTVGAHKDAFTKHTLDYFTRVQSIMARLRRQVYALEEAGIVAAEAPTLSTTSTAETTSRPAAGQGAGVRRGVPGQNPAAKPSGEDVERVLNGGLGNLDVGYLNSRGNKVGLEKEAELVGEAKKILQKMVEADGMAAAEP